MGDRCLPGLLILLERLHHLHYFKALDLSSCCSWQLEIRELQNLDAPPQIVARERNIIFIVRYNQARHLFTKTIRQTNNAQLFNVRRVRVQLFQLVRVNVLAVSVDDDLFRSPDEIEIAVFVQTPEVAGVEPAIDKRAAGRVRVFVVTEHDVWPTSNHFTNTACVSVGDSHLDARQGFPDASCQHPIRRSRDGQHRRCFSQAVALEDREAETLKIFLNVFAEGRAAADEIANTAAQALVNRIKKEL